MKVELEIHHGPVDEAPKMFELKFWFSKNRNPISIWLRSEMTNKEVIFQILEFVERVLFLDEE